MSLPKKWRHDFDGGGMESGPFMICDSNRKNQNRTVEL